MIKYKSTRGDPHLYSFSEVLLKGIAEDGGLLIPSKIPHFNLYDLLKLKDKTYKEVALFIFKLFQTGYPDLLLKKIIKQSYSNNFDSPQIAPLVKLKDKQYILELWHGPTSAFKDMALQIMPLLFSEAIHKDNLTRKDNDLKPLKYLILVATSGDTGKAALEGYKNIPNVSVMVFYPYNGVSKLQELSMKTQEGNNVEVVAMKGDFDDAQRSVKDVFIDKEFNRLLLKKYHAVLSSANSINWGRLLPQIIYHVRGYIDLVNQGAIKSGEEIDIAVPTGNFGNILSAFYAKGMGLPVRRFICASNENNVLTDFLREGIYDIRNRKLVKTSSPSMDIIVSSNLERLLYEVTQNPKKVSFWMKQLQENGLFSVDKKTLKLLKLLFYADWVTNEDCLSTIKKVYKEKKYLVDPHTAVAQIVAERYIQKQKSKLPVIICSTAHFSKFAEDVYKALNGSVDKKVDEFVILEKILKITSNTYLPDNIKRLNNKKILHKKRCKPGIEEIKQIILQFYSGYHY